MMSDADRLADAYARWLDSGSARRIREIAAQERWLEELAAKYGIVRMEASLTYDEVARQRDWIADWWLKTVAELIGQLSKFPADTKVFVWGGPDGDIPCDPDPEYRTYGLRDGDPDAGVYL